MPKMRISIFLAKFPSYNSEHKNSEFSALIVTIFYEEKIFLYNAVPGRRCFNCVIVLSRFPLLCITIIQSILKSGVYGLLYSDCFYFVALMDLSEKQHDFTVIFLIFLFTLLSRMVSIDRLN
jgi:hypothetical protein